MEKKVFDLSVTPTLLDAGEYAARRRKYEQIIASVDMDFKDPTGRKTDGFASPFEAAAWTPGGICDSAKIALSGIIGKGPIATENQLVAFFSLKPVGATGSASNSHKSRDD
jgi:hypothetical protein